jgi:phosphoribosylformylglycinamidine (FGAM) synthase-like enzyme
MAPFEVMISESQERCSRSSARSARRGRRGLRAVDLPCAVIGVVTDDGDITIVGSRGRPELARVPPAR